MKTAFEPPTTSELLAMDTNLREFYRKVLVFETNCIYRMYGVMTPDAVRYRQALHAIDTLNQLDAFDDFDANCPF